jgi:uncharacterized protein (TIGR01777 family)
MRVVIAGSTGLIGSALTSSLLADGHDVVRLVRRTAAPTAQADGRLTEARWDPYAGQLPVSVLTDAAAVVNLSGAGIADHRWTAAYKQTLRDSRVKTTTTIASAMAALDAPPPVLVNASAVGYYGETGDTPTDEDAGPGTDYLAGLCEEWEAAADPARKAGIRVAHARFGIVVTASGGAFGKLLPLARFGLGGKLGSGRQYWSYVSQADAVAALRHIAATDAVAGPVNITTPNPATNSEVTAVIGRALHRPTVFAVPGFALHLAIGGFAEGILMSQRIVPSRLLASGFTFAHPTIDAALNAALHP